MRLRSARSFLYAVVLLSFTVLLYQNRVFETGREVAPQPSPPWIVNLDDALVDTGQKNVVPTELKSPERAAQQTLVITTPPSRKVRLLCFVKTQQKSFGSKAQAVKNTWGRRCDKLIFVSNQANATLPAIGVQPDVAEARTTLSQKVFAAMKLIYQFYVDDFDWIQEADDDTYIVVENLRHFLADKDNSKPMYFGHRFKKFNTQGYTSGGAGYVMSNAALRLFGLHWEEHKECKLKGAGSDANMGHCLNALGVVLGDSTDSRGRSRFHVFDLETHILGLFPDWYYNYTGTDRANLKANYMNDYPISFHYSSNRKMYVLDYLFYESRVWGDHDRLKPAPPDNASPDMSHTDRLVTHNKDTDSKHRS